MFVSCDKKDFILLLMVTCKHHTGIVPLRATRFMSWEPFPSHNPVCVRGTHGEQQIPLGFVPLPGDDRLNPEAIHEYLASFYLDESGFFPSK